MDPTVVDVLRIYERSIEGYKEVIKQAERRLLVCPFSEDERLKEIIRKAELSIRETTLKHRNLLHRH
jgi:CO dehydrogenase/acetyl-CoA synthase epsilon subunit